MESVRREEGQLGSIRSKEGQLGSARGKGILSGFPPRWKVATHCTMAQALNKFGIKDFAKMIPSAPIFPLSLSNSLSFA